MTPTIIDIIFFLLFTLTLSFALIVAFAQNLLHSVFSLFAVVFGVAGFYLLLGGDFLAVVQILVYAGGVNMLLVFGTMLTLNIQKKESSNRSFHGFLSAATGLLVFSALVLILTGASWPKLADFKYQATTHAIGKLLLTNYLLPFEVVSFLLLAAMIGAIVYVHKGEK